MVRDGGLFMVFSIYSDRSVARAIRLEREKNTRHMSKKGESQKNLEKKQDNIQKLVIL